MIRCMLCGRPAGDDPEAKAREQAAREAAKATHQEKKPVWICPTCSGRTRHEADERGHGLRGRDRPPI